MQATLAVSDDAEAMADFLVAARDLQQTVLRETFAAAENGQITESGRTVCGEDTVLAPLDRLPRAVELKRCPVAGGAGLVHTHTTADQLRDPIHSLPDIGNVVLEPGVSASMIVGIETSELLLAPADRDEGHRLLEEALGFPVDSSHDIIRELGGRPPEEIARVRDDVQRSLAPLFRREQTVHRQFQQRLTHVPSPGTTAAAMPACSLMDHGHQHERRVMADTSAGRLRARMSDCGDGMKETADRLNLATRLRDEVIGQTIGTIVGIGVSRFVFGREP